MTGQLDLLAWHPPTIPNLHFQGDTYHAAFDCERLSDQQRRTWDAMEDGRWRTLREIEAITEDGQASVSARLRDFNNHKYLKQYFVMASRRRGDAKRGIWEYRVWLRSQ